MEETLADSRSSRTQSSLLPSGDLSPSHRPSPKGDAGHLKLLWWLACGRGSQCPQPAGVQVGKAAGVGGRGCRCSAGGWDSELETRGWALRVRLAFVHSFIHSLAYGTHFIECLPRSRYCSHWECSVSKPCSLESHTSVREDDHVGTNGPRGDGLAIEKDGVGEPQEGRPGRDGRAAFGQRPEWNRGLSAEASGGTGWRERGRSWRAEKRPRQHPGPRGPVPVRGRRSFADGTRRRISRR